MQLSTDVWHGFLTSVSLRSLPLCLWKILSLYALGPPFSIVRADIHNSRKAHDGGIDRLYEFYSRRRKIRSHLELLELGATDVFSYRYSIALAS
jgi:hypothetical protein